VTGPFFGEKSRFARKASAENMDLSLSAEIMRRDGKSDSLPCVVIVRRRDLNPQLSVPTHLPMYKAVHKKARFGTKITAAILTRKEEEG
jgi:hypothetical protein